MGVYVGFTNHFNTGSLVERTRGIRLAGNSLALVHRLWKELLGVLRSSEPDSAVMLTYCIWLGNTANVHRRFGKKGERRHRQDSIETRFRACRGLPVFPS